METLFRLSRDGRLPRHWCYGEAWELEADPYTGRVSWCDRRAPGFQGWTRLGPVVAALLGLERDGYYLQADYPWLLVVRVRSTYDGVGEWMSARVADVASVRAAPTAQVVRSAATAAPRAVRSDVHDLRAWLVDERHERRVRAAVVPLLKTVKPRFVETLPRPHRGRSSA